MSKHTNTLTLIDLHLDRKSRVPLHRQLYVQIRDLIVDGRLRAGQSLPSSRALASTFSISRSTVVVAFEQLAMEGYIDGRVGDATRVAEVVLASPSRARRGISRPAAARPLLSRRGSQLANASSRPLHLPHELVPFAPGLPAMNAFPHALWGRLSLRRWQKAEHDVLSYGEPAGYRPLREAIASHVTAARGARCDADQVIVVNGSFQAIEMALRLLTNPGDPILIEDPGYEGIRGAAAALGLRAIPVPVDAEGFRVDDAINACPMARIAYVTPSHQMPTGAILSASRRMQLLAWAQRCQGWIIEDDYDGVFRYRGQPLASLQGIDESNRVIYVSTFSKVLVPALRLAYVVAPPDLVDTFVAARRFSDRHSPGIEQAVLADFIEQGFFARHLRRMRSLYEERQALFIGEANRVVGDELLIEPSPAGMHLVGYFRSRLDDIKVVAAAADLGLGASALSTFSVLKPKPSGLVLGYAQADERETRNGMLALAQAVRAVRPSRQRRSNAGAA
jgi:GntR family transcriptional regulator / MocR family aminotransferase